MGCNQSKEDKELDYFSEKYKPKLSQKEVEKPGIRLPTREDDLLKIPQIKENADDSTKGESKKKKRSVSFKDSCSPRSNVEKEKSPLKTGLMKAPPPSPPVSSSIKKSPPQTKSIQFPHRSVIHESANEPVSMEIKLSEAKGSDPVSLEASTPPENFSKCFVNWDEMTRAHQKNNLNNLTNDLKRDIDVVVMNLLLMSYQFTKNFDREKQRWAERKRDIEKMYNSKLEDTKNNITVVNAIFSSIQENCGVKAGATSNIIEPFIPLESFIFYENVEVERLEHYESLRYGSMKYMDVDKPIYKVCMEPSKNIGFSKLRLVEESSRRNSADLLGSEQYLRLPSSPSIASSDPDSGQGSCFGSSHHASNNENGAHYLKLRLRDLKDIPLDGDGDEVKGHWVELPPSCFKTTMVSFIEDDDTESCRVEGPVEPRTYISSKQFNKHFVNSFFHIAFTLERQRLLSKAKHFGAKIICQEEMPGGRGRYGGVHIGEMKECFIPSVTVPFLPEEALEWQMRNRRSLKDIRTDVTIRWPPLDFDNDFKRLGCNLIPTGFLSPIKGDKKQARDMTLEWKIEFTKSEHLLMRSLNPPKLRILIFCQLLYKTFLTTTEGVKAHHFQHLLYWLFSEKPENWEDENLGLKLIEVMNIMSKKLRKGILPNYFMRKSNLFGATADHLLLHAENRTFRICENMIFHLIFGLKNLQYARGFYPLPDLDELVRILTEQHSFALLHRSQGQVGPKANTSLEYNKLPQYKINKMDDARKKMILEFFIQHFIEMAKKSNEYRSYGQSLMYLMQAENMVQVVKEMGYEGSNLIVESDAQLQHMRDISHPSSIQQYWSSYYGMNLDDHFQPSLTVASNRASIKSNVSLRQGNPPLPDIPRVRCDSNNNHSDSACTVIEVP